METREDLKKLKKKITILRQVNKINKEEMMNFLGDILVEFSLFV